jgi:hypothetical protein
MAAIVVMAGSSCHSASESTVQRAVIARTGTADIQLHLLREMPERAISPPGGQVVRVGAGVCGELRGGPHNERYFIWERATGKVFLADESGVVSGGTAPFLWRSYCREGLPAKD